ncbi:Polypeptide N-acetylgalactosaminyltransferase 16 [Labeo rohita]|uniref:Polypeptide N-acetylgalactosaminyltransferase 16 n=1 Tax=Labeo rohita TaxID=84645 RepID=A0ABQ8LVS8_LABRO|nr:Polypeptide N-acetylgalactosaminyltransferase 16 [Labeo rohita]
MNTGLKQPRFTSGVTKLVPGGPGVGAKLCRDTGPPGPDLVTHAPKLEQQAQLLGQFDEKAFLSSKQLKAGEDPYREHAFNLQESDRLGSERAIRDTRHYRCASMTFDPDLPPTSIIITFHNEARSTLLRTIKSAHTGTPRAVGSHCSSAWGALLKGTSVMVLKAERALFFHNPHLQFLLVQESNQRPSGYKPDSLTIRPFSCPSYFSSMLLSSSSSFFSSSSSFTSYSSSSKLHITVSAY